MVSINNLEVRFDVEGEGDDAAFARLFEKYVRQWSSKHEAAKARDRLTASEGSLGDQQGEHE
jgi:hypothetical protein